MIQEANPYQILTMSNSNGIEMTVTNLGARVMTLLIPDKNGEVLDVVLGYDTPKEYLTSPEPFLGTAVGRYGNRIAKGKFELDGQTYSLALNNGPNSLHGGPGGFHNVIWTVEEADDSHIVFTYLSKDGEEGFPGNLTVKMTYYLTEDNEFKITYEAETDKATPVNLTHHSFFNLNGAGNGDILGHELQLMASKYTPVDSTLIPLGDNVPVAGTPFDFTEAKTIGRDINKDNQQIKFGGGFDHNWVLDKKEEGALELAAVAYSPASGIEMEVYTTEPGIQFYAGNFLDGTAKGKGGKAYEYRSAFCLETQHFPDSPNQPNFPSTILIPGEKYEHTCIYKFDTK
ncbi:aldose epimerase family protein [Algoriphagus sp. SE2]|uniref:aldose epimerase family protein n=1 Tax=Algoriphagus sp. SE2 TaxID=3141536 RepID=UPI0031CD2DDA